MPRNRRPQDRGAKREEIVAAARRLFVDEGYEATPMGRLAEQAGISANTIYWYFRDKDDVLLAVLDQVQTEATKEYFALSQTGLPERMFWLVKRLDSVSKLISTVHSRVPMSDSLNTWHDTFHSTSEMLLRGELLNAGTPAEHVDDVVKVFIFAVEGMLIHDLDDERKRSICHTLVRQVGITPR